MEIWYLETILKIVGRTGIWPGHVQRSLNIIALLPAVFILASFRRLSGRKVKIAHYERSHLICTSENGISPLHARCQQLPRVIMEQHCLNKGYLNGVCLYSSSEPSHKHCCKMQTPCILTMTILSRQTIYCTKKSEQECEFRADTSRRMFHVNRASPADTETRFLAILIA
jgi:hypothetical protein